MEKVELLPDCCYLVRSWVEENLSHRLYQNLLNNVEWEQRTFMGNKPDRKNKTYGNEGLIHKYSGTKTKVIAWGKDLGRNSPEFITYRFKELILENTGYNTNMCLLNYYPDGNAKIGWHSDTEGDPVVTISLGETRKFKFREIRNHKNTIEINLNSGDMVVMYGECQKKYNHEIPLENNKEGRISLTYRIIGETF